MRCGRILVGLVATTVLLSSCTSGGDEETATTRAAETTTTTEPPLDMQAHAESLLVEIRSEGDFLNLDAPGTVTVGEGSGVVIAANDGLILTTANSVVGADRINIYVPGEEFPLVGEIDAAAECANLALVRVDHAFPASLTMEVAGPPVAVASATQQGVSAAPVTASQSVESFSLANAGEVPFGSVVFDENGSLAGIVTGYGPDGDPLALLGEITAEWVSEMRQRNVVQQLGFAPVANTEGQPVVAAVAASGPGADLGLEVGDVVIKADGGDIIDGVRQLCTALEDGVAELEVIKGGRRHVGAIPDRPLVLASARTTDQIRRAVVEVGTDAGTGSGFFVSSDGLLVTNYHVAGHASSVRLRFDASDDTITGDVVAASACADLAVIQAEPGEYEYLEWSPEPPRLEEPVRAVGFPRGTQSISFQDGIVAKEATPSTSWVGSISTFETSAVIDRGNSGGPVVNEAGEVIGVSYAAITRDESVVQNNLHLVAVEARGVIEGLLDGSRTDPGFRLAGWENVYYVDMRKVTDLFPGGAAAAAGLQPGDALAQLGDLEGWQDFDEVADICSYFDRVGPDAVLDFVGYRSSTGALFEGQINGAQLAEWPSDFRQGSADGTISAFIPGPWGDVESIEPADGNDWVGFFAAPSISDYYARFGAAPGMRLMWSYQRGEEYDTRSWFDAVTYSALADGPPEEYFDFSFEGHFQHFETSSGSRSIEYALRELDNPDGPLILLYVSLPDGLLPGKAFEIADSLVVEPPPPPVDE